MNYTVVLTDNFKREFKRLFKKYRSLEQELIDLCVELVQNPSEGTLISTLPNDNRVYKIRLAVKSKGKGKSGGMRVISYTVALSGHIYLLSIYDKSEKETVTNVEIKAFLENLPI
jgi:mRNA-degrading endonuclease RelE of RelBE toxin-antitoxin system